MNRLIFPEIKLTVMCSAENNKHITFGTILKCIDIPYTIIRWDTIKIKADPIIVRGKEDWEKGVWIAGTLLINLVVYLAGREIKKRKSLK